MAKNKLSIAKVMLVLIIMLCFGVVMGVTAYGLNLKKNPPVAGNEIAGWETYTNKDYGYEFKHPKDWTIGGFDTPGSTIIEIGNNRMIIVGVGENPKELPVEEWLNKPGDTAYKTTNDQINERLQADYYDSIYKGKKIVINGIEGIDEVLIWNGSPRRRSIILPVGKKVYTFSPAPMEDSNEYNIFNTLISTFRVTGK